MLLNQTKLAVAFGVTPRTIRDWEDAGMPSEGKGRKRKYSVPDCIAWRLEVERARVEQELAPQLEAEEGPTLNEARRRKEAAIAALRETELEELRGNLLPLVEHRYTLAQIASVVRSLPRRRDFLSGLAPKVGGRQRDAIPAAELASRLIIESIRELIGDVDDAA